MNIAHYIDHTLLKPDATEAAIKTLCGEAIEYGFFSVCVSPTYVKTAAHELSRSKARVCTVIGFPHGANLWETKRREAELALRDGASELDMVINLGAAKSGDWSVLEREIKPIVELAFAAEGLVKVIIECALLTDDEKKRATEIVAASGAAFVKTSTGYASHGATIEDVRLLHKVAAGRCKVKAAGGIRDLATAKAMIAAGAERLGTSAGIALVQGVASETAY